MLEGDQSTLNHELSAGHYFPLLRARSLIPQDTSACNSLVIWQVVNANKYGLASSKLAGKGMNGFVSRHNSHVVSDCRYANNSFRLAVREVFQRRAEEIIRQPRHWLGLGVERAWKQLGMGDFKRLRLRKRN